MLSRTHHILLTASLAALVVFSARPCLSQGTVHRLPREMNTAANEYLPVPGVLEGEEVLWFTGMDRTGFFDFKLDVIDHLISGGEDLWYAKRENGVWTDARPFTTLNTHAHEALTHATHGRLEVTANWPETLGPGLDDDPGTQGTDLFHVELTAEGPVLRHYPEPINSIFTEADGHWIPSTQTLWWVSDRPDGLEGSYQKKGWRWNDSYWGNTDILFCAYDDLDLMWGPVQRPAGVNTPFAERTPVLSGDGLTLWLSSNGHHPEGSGRTDLDIVRFDRADTRPGTPWQGPVLLDHLNTALDEWGYRPDGAGGAWFARARPLNHVPTQGAPGGDAGSFRETNFRQGYEVFGRQLASLDRTTRTDLYRWLQDDAPFAVLGDVLFDFDRHDLRPEAQPLLEQVAMVCRLNPDLGVVIHGHTDAIGTADHNLGLSRRRAEAVRQALLDMKVTNAVSIEAWGATRPLNPTSSDQANRRVAFQWSPVP